MKKLIFAALSIVAVLSVLFLCVDFTTGATSGLVYHTVQVVDETGASVTDISSVDIYTVDTTTSQTIYSDRELNNTITLPMTTSSTNTTLSNGRFSWWGASGYDFSVTDGTNTATNANHRTRTPSDGQIVFPSYLQSISSTTYTDSQTATFGTGSDWVIQGGATADLLTFTPATNGAVFRIGESDGSPCADFQVYTASGVGFLIDEGANTFGVTGLTVNLNASSNYATNICTGTSSGATTIGNTASGGNVSLNSASTGSAAIALQNTAGTLDIDVATVTFDCTYDLTIQNTADRDGDDFSITQTGAYDASLLLSSAGTGSDALSLQCTAGTLDIDASTVTFNGTYDFTITNTADRAGDDLTITQLGAYDSSLLLNSAGTGSDALSLQVTAGTLDIDAATVTFNGTYDMTFINTADRAGDDFFIWQAGAYDASLDLRSAGTGSDAMNMDVTGTGGSLDIDVTAGSVTINTVSSTTGNIVLTSACARTNSAAIGLQSTSGTLDIDSATITITSTDNGSAALNIDVTNAGGFDLDTSGGPIAITAGGASAGDITITAGDDFTLSSTGSTTLGEIGFERLPVAAGQASTTLAAADSGHVFYNVGSAGSRTYHLPTAAAGLMYTFIDLSATAGDRIGIMPAAGDYFSGCSASTTLWWSPLNAGGATSIIAVDTTTWVQYSASGTWVTIDTQAADD